MHTYITCMGGNGNAELRVCHLDCVTGQLQTLSVTNTGVKSPLYADIDAQGRYMYVADHMPDCDGTLGGAICAYQIEPDSGKLNYLNRRPSRGQTPCYIAISADGKFVLTANYSNGSVAVLPIGDGGLLGEAVTSVQHEGSSVTDRQTGPHAHCFRFDLDNHFALAADLGADRVVVYRFNSDTGGLSPNEPTHASTPPGAGPRHITFSADARFAYVINELDNTITVMGYDNHKGVLDPQQTISTLPVNFGGTSWASDIHLHPNGKFLYGTNRGDGAPSSIVIYAIDPTTGTLNLIGHKPTQGDFPRGFGIDPTGRILVVANQESDNVMTFTINVQSGKLTASGHSVEVPKPVCINFAEAS